MYGFWYLCPGTNLAKTLRDKWVHFYTYSIKSQFGSSFQFEMISLCPNSVDANISPKYALYSRFHVNSNFDTYTLIASSKLSIINNTFVELGVDPYGSPLKTALPRSTIVLI